MRRVLCGDWHQPELCHGDGVVEGLVSDRPGDSDGEGRNRWREVNGLDGTVGSGHARSLQGKADSNIGMSTPWSFALPTPWPCAMRLLLACTTRSADCVKGRAHNNMSQAQMVDASLQNGVWQLAGAMICMRLIFVRDITVISQWHGPWGPPL